MRKLTVAIKNLYSSAMGIVAQEVDFQKNVCTFLLVAFRSSKECGIFASFMKINLK